MELTNYQPAKPANPDPVQGGPKPAQTGAQPGAGAITEADVLKGGDSAKLSTLSLSDYAKGPNGSGSPNPGNQQAVGAFVDAKIVLSVADAIIPSLIVIAFSFAKITVNAGDFRLTAKEQDTLAGPLQKCLESLMVNFNSPWTALAVTALGIYAGKAAIHGFNGAKDKKATEKAAKEAQERTAAEGATVVTSEGRVVPIDPGAVQVTPNGTLLRPWGANELARIMQKKKISKEKAIAWLNANWEKKGGVI